MDDDTPTPPPRINRTETLRVRVTPAGRAEAERLARAHGHPDVSAYVRDLLAADSRRHPAV